MSSTSSSSSSSSSSTPAPITGKWVVMHKKLNSTEFTHPSKLTPVSGTLVTTYVVETQRIFPKDALTSVVRYGGLVPVSDDLMTSKNRLFYAAHFTTRISEFNDALVEAERQRDGRTDRRSVVGVNQLIMSLEAQAALGDEAMKILASPVYPCPYVKALEDSLARVTPIVFRCIRAALARKTYTAAPWDRYKDKFDIQRAAVIVAWDPHVAASFLSVLLSAYAMTASVCPRYTFAGTNSNFISFGVDGCYSILDMVALLLVVLTQLDDHQYCVYSRYMGVPVNINCTNRRLNYRTRHDPVPIGLFTPLPVLERELCPVDYSPTPAPASPEAIPTPPSPVGAREGSFDDDTEIKNEDDFWAEEDDRPTVTEEVMVPPREELACDEELSAEPTTPIMISDSDSDDPDGPCDDTQIVEDDSEVDADEEMEAHFSAFYNGRNNRHWKCHSAYAKHSGRGAHWTPRYALSLGDKPISLGTPVSSYLGVPDHHVE